MIGPCRVRLRSWRSACEHGPARDRMKPSDLTLLLVALPLVPAIVWVANRRGAFRADAFPTPWRRNTALVLLGLLLGFTSVVPGALASAGVRGGPLRLLDITLIQQALALFLAAWWLLAGRPPLLPFLGLTSHQALRDAWVGVVVGLAGWGLTVAAGMVVALVKGFLGLSAAGPSPVVLRVGAMPFASRLAIVAIAMTVEELFFRAFLQRRLGAAPASLLFVVAHAGYGDPFFFVGLLAITTVLALAWERTGSVIAPVVAHGTFDGVQLLVVLPLATRYAG